MWIWRQFPRQITNDLSRYHKREMREWHADTLSSYDLMVYLEFMDDRGAFKKALRGDEYSEDQITWRHIANEVARLRATMHAVHGGQRYDPPTFKTQAEIRAEQESAEFSEDRRESVFAFADRPALALTGAPPLDPDDLWDGE